MPLDNIGAVNLLSNQFVANVTSEDDEAKKDNATFRKTTYNKRFWFFMPKKYFTATTHDEILAEFKKMISQKPIEVQYELAEEVIEPLDEEQKEVIDNISTKLGYQKFSSEANMRIKYVRNTGFQDTYELKSNADKKYQETTKKLAEFKIETESISSNVENVTNNLESLSSETLKLIQDFTHEFKEYQATVSTQFEQTNTDFTFTFNTLLEQMKSNNDTANEQLINISKYIRFENGDIILGQTDNPLILKIQNDRISYQQNGSEVAYFTNNKLYVTTLEVTERLQMGKFAYTLRDNGSLSFGKVRV